MAAEVLERLLITLAVRIHAFAVCEIEAGWRLLFDPMEAVTIHYVLAGEGTIETGEGAGAPFAPHSIIVVPARVPQSLGEPDARAGQAAAGENCSLLDDGLVKFTAGDGSRDTLVACGTISATYGGALGLFEHLREPIVEHVGEIDAMRHAFSLLLSEMSRPGLGTQALAEALMKQCLILLLRQHLRRLGADSPFFAAMRDQRLVRAVTSVLERPSAPHSVESLASVAGMSRSTFAERFRKVYGQAPIEFVQKVRLRLGAHMLSATDLPVKVIAGSVGYASRTHFSKAFRDAYGADPKTFRAFGGAEEEEARPFVLEEGGGAAG